MVLADLAASMAVRGQMWTKYIVHVYLSLCFDSLLIHAFNSMFNYNVIAVSSFEITSDWKLDYFNYHADISPSLTWLRAKLTCPGQSDLGFFYTADCNNNFFIWQNLLADDHIYHMK